MNPAVPTPCSFSPAALQLDAAAEIARLTEAIYSAVHHTLHRQGVVLGISGGIDSSVALALCVKAVGKERVLGLLLPEKESDPLSAELALELAEIYGIETVREDITPALEGLGCYRRRDEAVRRVFPQFETGWGIKISLPDDLMIRGSLNVFTLTVTDPQGLEYRQRLPLREYYQIVAASNFKQRVRTNFLYYHAERCNYAVIGTPNKNEHELGFFVKFGDGGYDLAPLRGYYKTQVYQLAGGLGIPEAICSRPPTTDTYPGGKTQEEFFYRIPFHLLDLIWCGAENQLPAPEIARALSLSVEQVNFVIKDIERKKMTTAYLRTAMLGIGSGKSTRDSYEPT